ncbi:hypothetical protein [Microlunatus sp. GCM10028923]|uniref:hypothetical protein n=1 Tax=Microlunatus sp. GCM10028923 TaxID=3273400 RepID=UPI00361EBC15
MTEFPVYKPGQSSEATPENMFYVLVEFSNHGEAKPPTLIEYGVEQAFPTLEQATQEARRVAFEFEPPDPFSPAGRQVFQTNEREFVTIIQGAWTTFHFFTRVGQYLGGS